MYLFDPNGTFDIESLSMLLKVKKMIVRINQSLVAHTKKQNTQFYIFPTSELTQVDKSA